MRELVWTQGAENDYLQLYDELESFRPGRGDEFDVNLHHKLELLRRNAEMAPVYKGRFRRLILSKSNVGVYYVIDTRGIIIHSCTSLFAPPHVIALRIDENL